MHTRTSPPFDPIFVSPARFFICASIVAHGGRVRWIDVARESRFFGSGALLTAHNRRLTDEGYIRVERGGLGKFRKSLVLTDLGRKRFAAHRAALLDLIKENTG